MRRVLDFTRRAAVSPRKLMRAPLAIAREGERERGKRRAENKQSICMDIYICIRQGGETSCRPYTTLIPQCIIYIYILPIMCISPLQPTRPPPPPQILCCRRCPGPSRIANLWALSSPRAYVYCICIVYAFTPSPPNWQPSLSRAPIKPAKPRRRRRVFNYVFEHAR